MITDLPLEHLGYRKSGVGTPEMTILAHFFYQPARVRKNDEVSLISHKDEIGLFQSHTYPIKMVISVCIERIIACSETPSVNWSVCETIFLSTENERTYGCIEL